MAGLVTLDKVILDEKPLKICPNIVVYGPKYRKMEVKACAVLPDSQYYLYHLHLCVLSGNDRNNICMYVTEN